MVEWIKHGYTRGKALKRITSLIRRAVENYDMIQEGDKVVFTMKKSKEDDDPIIQKTITEFEEGYVIVPILPEDTINLEKASYVYDIKLMRNDGNVDTLLPNNRESAPFLLKKGVRDAND